MTAKPLTKRVMSLSKLQARTLKVLKLCKKQFNRLAHEEGLTDEEFKDQVLNPLIEDITTDRYMLKMLKAAEQYVEKK